MTRVLMVDTSKSAPPAPNATSSTPPATVSEVGEHAENLYDAATAKKWNAAQAIMDSLAHSADALPNDARISAQRTQMPAVLDSLRAAVTAHDANRARKLANRVTYLSAQMTAPYSPATPTEVLLLDYYGRELQIWSTERDQAKLAQTTAALRKTWDALAPVVKQHGGSAAASSMESDVRRIEASRTPAQYASAAAPFLEQVDVLEKVFTKQ